MHELKLQGLHMNNKPLKHNTTGKQTNCLVRIIGIANHILYLAKKRSTSNRRVSARSATMHNQMLITQVI